MEDNHSLDMVWTKCPARLVALWSRTTRTITLESRTQMLQWLHSLILLSWQVENEILLVLLSSNFPAIRICKDLMVAMHINFISSSCSSKCRSNHCIISQLGDLPMDQVQAMETMLKVTITSMETSSMGVKTKTKTIKHQTKTLEVPATNFCSNLKKSFTLHPQERRRSRPFEVLWFLMVNRQASEEVTVVNKLAILEPNRAMMEIEIKPEPWYDIYVQRSIFIKTVN